MDRKAKRIVDLRQKHHEGCQHAVGRSWCGATIVAVWEVWPTNSTSDRPLVLPVCREHDAKLEQQESK